MLKSLQIHMIFNRALKDTCNASLCPGQVFLIFSSFLRYILLNLNVFSQVLQFLLTNRFYQLKVLLPNLLALHSQYKVYMPHVSSNLQCLHKSLEGAAGPRLGASSCLTNFPFMPIGQSQFIVQTISFIAGDFG